MPNLSQHSFPWAASSVKLFLIVSTLFCLLTAISSLAGPKAFGQRLGLAIASADGFNEIRAQYGGFFLAVALAGAAALAGVIRIEWALFVNLVVFGGLICGRLASLFFDGGITGYGQVIRGLFLVDSLGFVAAALALTFALHSATEHQWQSRAISAENRAVQN
jgi:Domain of unknown function (DUF4345)